MYTWIIEMAILIIDLPLGITFATNVQIQKFELSLYIFPNAFLNQKEIYL